MRISGASTTVTPARPARSAASSSTHWRRHSGAGNGSAQYVVSRYTRPSRSWMMSTTRYSRSFGYRFDHSAVQVSPAPATATSVPDGVTTYWSSLPRSRRSFASQAPPG